MAPSKKYQKSHSPTRTPSTGTPESYDGGSESSISSLPESFSTSTARSSIGTTSSGYSGSSRTPSKTRWRRRTPSRSLKSLKGTSRASSSGASVRSVLSDRKKRSTKKTLVKPLKKESEKSEKIRPINQFQMVKDKAVKEQVRNFVTDYTKDPEFETFSLTVDGVPFVAISLMNADEELREQFLKKMPPTPMKKHVPGANKPRKRRLSQCSSHCSTGRKSVRFTDEGTRRSSSERDLSKTISDSMIETDRKYHELWHDRVEDNK